MSPISQYALGCALGEVVALAATFGTIHYNPLSREAKKRIFIECAKLITGANFVSLAIGSLVIYVTQ